jgi:AraC-like DNA-binding protein
MGYREHRVGPEYRDLVETAWTSDGPGADVRVLPDGCMDLIRLDGQTIVAGPDTTAAISRRGAEPVVGLRFRPGMLPRLLDVPARELVDQRVPLRDVRRVRSHGLLDVVGELATGAQRRRTAPWPVAAVRDTTARVAAGVSAADIAASHGWSPRTLHRHSLAVYGYGPVTLRRILRFRRAVALLEAGTCLADAAAAAGYADQPHLHRESRVLAGVSLRALGYGSAANRSTVVPPGSDTLA